jgi:hypothetical protein
MVFGDCFVDSMLTTTAIGRRQLQGRDAETLVDILMRVVVSYGVNLQWWAATLYRLLLLKTDLVFIHPEGYFRYDFGLAASRPPACQARRLLKVINYLIIVRRNDMTIIIFGPQTTISYFEVLRYVASSRKQHTIAK